MSTNFTPNNKLEELLMAATGDATQRPAFCRELLESELLFVTEQDEVGTRLTIWQFQGEETIAAFSSLPRLQHFMQQIQREEGQYAQMKGRELIEMVHETPVMLNPLSDYGKMFYPEEMVGLLDESGFKHLKIINIETDQQILLSQPADYPQKLVDALKQACSQSGAVARAYLAQLHQPGYRFPQFVIGIEVSGEIDQGAILSVAMDELADDQFATFIGLGDDPISDYMRESVTPFYQA